MSPSGFTLKRKDKKEKRNFGRIKVKSEISSFSRIFSLLPAQLRLMAAKQVVSSEIFFFDMLHIRRDLFIQPFFREAFFLQSENGSKVWLEKLSLLCFLFSVFIFTQNKSFFLESRDFTKVRSLMSDQISFAWRTRSSWSKSKLKFKCELNKTWRLTLERHMPQQAWKARKIVRDTPLVQLPSTLLNHLTFVDWSAGWLDLKRRKRQEHDWWNAAKRNCFLISNLSFGGRDAFFFAKISTNATISWFKLAFFYEGVQKNLLCAHSCLSLMFSSVGSPTKAARREAMRAN